MFCNDTPNWQHITSNKPQNSVEDMVESGNGNVIIVMWREGTRDDLPYGKIIWRILRVVLEMFDLYTSFTL